MNLYIFVDHMKKQQDIVLMKFYFKIFSFNIFFRKKKVFLKGFFLNDWNKKIKSDFARFISCKNSKKGNILENILSCEHVLKRGIRVYLVMQKCPFIFIWIWFSFKNNNLETGILQCSQLIIL